MALSDRLNSTCTVLRKSRSSDGRGGSTITYSTAIASVACRISLKSSRERDLGDKQDSEGEYKIFVLAATDAKLHDKFDDGTNQFEVVSIGLPSRGNHKELSARLVTDSN